jgi:lipid-binding SYLF domain-containing protein
MAIPQNRDFEENKMNMNVNNPQDRGIGVTNTTTTTTTTSDVNRSSDVVGSNNLTGSDDLVRSFYEDPEYWHYCERHSFLPESNIDDEPNVNDESHGKWKYYKEKRHHKRMETLLCNSYDMLKEYFDPKLYPNHQIPCDLFKNCKGVVFLRIWKAGIVIGGIGGTGIVLSHRDGKWSNPCAISVGGLQFGLNLGVERVDDILLLRDDAALNLLFEKGHFKLGADASIAVGPYGRDANMGVAMSGKDTKSIYSYSFAKGAFVGLSLDGGSITVNDKVNEEFYGRKIPVRDILFSDIDNVSQNDDFLRLQQSLNDYCLSQNMNKPLVDTTTTNTTDTTNFNPVINK